MPRDYVIDTHALIWWLLAPESLSRNAVRILDAEGNRFHVCTMSLLEIQYLLEIGRIRLDMAELLSYLRLTPNFAILPFDELSLAAALKGVATRDPFDRVILSTALAREWQVLSKDAWMRRHFPASVVW